MLPSQNFGRSSSILYLQTDKENRQKIGIPMGTDYCRSYRLIGKYTFGYEFDFSVFQESYAAANGVTVKAVYGFILSIIGMNGVPEAIVAGVLVFFIGRILMKRNIRERLGFINDFSD